MESGATTATTATPPLGGGRREHRMITAFPGRRQAKMYGLNRNHHVRVWCSCMDDPVFPAGTFGATERSARDYRRVNWDWIGIADVRIPGSALAIWRKHIEEVDNATTRRVQG